MGQLHVINTRPGIGPLPHQLSTLQRGTKVYIRISTPVEFAMLTVVGWVVWGGSLSILFRLNLLPPSPAACFAYAILRTLNVDRLYNALYEPDKRD